RVDSGHALQDHGERRALGRVDHRRGLCHLRHRPVDAPRIDRVLVDHPAHPWRHRHRGKPWQLPEAVDPTLEVEHSFVRRVVPAPERASADITPERTVPEGLAAAAELVELNPPPPNVAKLAD